MKTSRTIPVLAIIVPCYNEEALIENTKSILNDLVNRLIKADLIGTESFILFVDDGSKDLTLDLLKKNKQKCQRIISLSRNRGHQYALHAGLMYCLDKVDCVVTIDADLQHDVEIIDVMLKEYSSGIHMVLGVRRGRYKETLFKRLTSRFFYWGMNKMGVRLVKNHSDFRLLSNQVLVELQKYEESNLFLRGIFPLINYPQKSIFYTQRERSGGISKYTPIKMISLALEGMTSFSSVPIRIITILGLMMFFVSLALSINVVLTFLKGDVVPGWASITLPLYFLGGIQLLCLGVLGEYIAKIYKETKRRPHYHISEIID